MSASNKLADRYFNTKLNIPGPALQWLLNTYLGVDHILETKFGKNFDYGFSSGDQIADSSKELMNTHYDMPLPLFTNFLGDSMKYSMALWEKGARDLDEAQEHMLRNVCKRPAYKMATPF